MRPQNRWPGILKKRLSGRTATLGIVGMGYVGLPLAIAAQRAGFTVVGFDIDAEKVKVLNRGQSPIHNIDDKKVAAMVESGKFHASADFDEMKKINALMICVPTPLVASPRARRLVHRGRREGDRAAPAARPDGGAGIDHLSRHDPAMCCARSLRRSGLRAGSDFFIAFQPGARGPGQRRFRNGDDPPGGRRRRPITADLAVTLYEQIITKVVPVVQSARRRRR